MRDYYGGPVEDATNAYLADYAREQEQAERDEAYLSRHCMRCDWCGELILPRHRAARFEVDAYGDMSKEYCVHDWHIDWCSGEELME